MSKLKINQEELLSLYQKQVEEICEECDWKTHFDIKDIITIVTHVLEKNSHLIIDSDEYERGFKAGFHKGLSVPYLT